MLATRCKLYDFRGAISPPVVGSRQGEWCKKITAAAGSPTVAAVLNGRMELTLDSTTEVQNLCLYTGDILPWAVQDIQRIWINATLTTMAAGITASFGLASARNDAIASISAFALLQATGANSGAISAFTKDGTTTTGGIATGINLSTTLQRFCIDFTGVQTKMLPSASMGNRSFITFHQDNPTVGGLRQVCKNTLFDMSAYGATSGLQLFAQLQKTAVAAVATLGIESFEVEYKVR